MAKLRKMLGKVDDPQIVSLMRMIETQSKATLAGWASAYAAEQYLPIYEQAYPEDSRLRELTQAVSACLAGERKLAELKPMLRESRQIAQEAEGDPAAQAAARALSTACAAIQTPTNALGFAFYGAAAMAYAQEGLEASPGRYDVLALAEFERIAQSLQAVLVPDEPNSAKINWNC